MDDVGAIGAIVGKEPTGIVFLIVDVSVEDWVPFSAGSVVDFGWVGKLGTYRLTLGAWADAGDTHKGLCGAFVDGTGEVFEAIGFRGDLGFDEGRTSADGVLVGFIGKTGVLVRESFEGPDYSGVGGKQSIEEVGFGGSSKVCVCLDRKYGLDVEV